MTLPPRVTQTAAGARSVRRALTTALRRPSTYPGAVKELLFTGLNIALYPAGLVGEALETDASTGALRGRFSRPFALRYLDPDAAATPIVLVHGYFHNRSAFVMMRRALRRAGFLHVDSMNYSVIGNDVDALARRLAEHVDAVLGRTGASKVHLVGHSLGGLVARLYVQQYGGEHTVHTCVTLGTPHNGTYTALLGRGKAALALRPNSELIRRLKATSRPMPVRFVSYYSNLDALVVPASSAKITDEALAAQNVLVKDLGHMSLLISSPLMHSIALTLGDLRGDAAGDATVTVMAPKPRPRVKRSSARSGAEGA